MFSTGKITFEDNPWPDGHRVASFAWSGRLFPGRGVTFDFDLRTADYYENDDHRIDEDEEEEIVAPWKSKSVWSNYHACTISSVEWGESEGFLVGTAKKPLDLDALDGTDFRIDKLPPSGKPTFATYLLGHDSVADHRIAFSCSRTDTADAYDISWRGKIALTYAGETEFCHRFDAAIGLATFDGFRIPKGLDGKSAANELGRFVIGGGDWTCDRRGGALWLLRPTGSIPVKAQSRAPAKRKAAAKKTATKTAATSAKKRAARRAED